MECIAYVFPALMILVWVLAIARRIKNKYAPVRTVQAVVIDKQEVTTFSKYAGNGAHRNYVVVFSAGGKKLSFYVSQFSYDSYKINEAGLLKYQGNKLINFTEKKEGTPCFKIWRLAD